MKKDRILTTDQKVSGLNPDGVTKTGIKKYQKASKLLILLAFLFLGPQKSSNYFNTRVNKPAYFSFFEIYSLEIGHPIIQQ
jgi:hypothetical protein